MAPIRQVAPGGGVEFEVDPSTGHSAWRVAGRRANVARARSVAGDGAVDRIDGYGYWWSSTQNGFYYAWYRYLYGSAGDVGFHCKSKNDGLGVRCLRN